ncbi:MAG: AAA family ATPase [Clostridia bacterium]|nr:AAA family ATPase [Clostridia bacterium]
MYLSKVFIENFRLFSQPVEVSFQKGLNLLVGENGSGKSAVLDAIRALLNENEFSRRGITEEDFSNNNNGTDLHGADRLSITGIFSDLSEEQKIEYLTWLDNSFNAKLNLEVQNRLNNRNRYNQKRWGGNSSNSIFDSEPLNDIQCVYLPALRDAERNLRTGRGSRLARFIANLSADLLKEKRKNGELMPLEDDLKAFNEKAAGKEEIAKANKLINDSIQNAAGSVYGQKTQIQFNTLSYERIIESLQILFSEAGTDGFRNLAENSLGYNNLIYIATILAEFEGLKDKYTTPRILLIEELEAHLHPQLQIKLLKYLQQQTDECRIQVIISTHSPLIAASVPIDKIISFNRVDGSCSITSLFDCGMECSASRFLNRWLDATKTALLFSKGNLFVEGIGEAILIPILAKRYLSKKKAEGACSISSLEEAGISVINMNGIYFHYFLQLYNGYKILLPERVAGETKENYTKKITELRKKTRLSNGEYEVTSRINIRCAVLTDNDPAKKIKPSLDDDVEGNNPQLWFGKQVSAMTDNCRVYVNKKTFEYDLSIENKCNAQIMLNILLEAIPTDGSIKEQLESYITRIAKEETIDEPEMAASILEQIESDYMGKGLFAQLLAEKLSKQEEMKFDIPQYICKAINFLAKIGE